MISMPRKRCTLAVPRAKCHRGLRFSSHVCLLRVRSELAKQLNIKVNFDQNLRCIDAPNHAMNPWPPIRTIFAHGEIMGVQWDQSWLNR